MLPTIETAERIGSGRAELLADPTRIVIGLLIAVRLIVAGLGVVEARGVGGNLDVDVTRFHQIATSDGRPYRDFDVEYAPVETVAIEIFAGGDRRQTAVRLAVISLACDVLAFAAIGWGWGRRASSLYLLIGLPLVPFIYFRLDTLVVALAVWGLALARRGASRSGGLLFGMAALTKLWPLVLAPSLFIQRRWRALRWFLAVFGAGVVAWTAYGGPGAIRQVVSFRGATGWEVASTIGVVSWLLTGGPVRLESGASRVGSIPGWSGGVLLVLLVAALVRIWTNPRGRLMDDAGARSLAALGVLLVLAPVFSLQYALWIVPWAAIAWTHPDTTSAGRLAFGVTLLTGCLALFFLAVDAEGWSLAAVRWIAIGLLVVRNGLCACLAIPWLAPARIGLGDRASARP
jgi:glycosyl transferase family 87